jgi:hypothetical protein
VNSDDDTQTRTRLLWDWEQPVDTINDVSPIHPSLADLPTNGYSGAPGNMSSARFEETPSLPKGMEQGAYGAIRFVPHRDNSGNPHTITERAGFDLNEDGATTDSYALGRIEILHFSLAGMVQRTTVSSNTVLLQLNTDSKSSKPLFKLRRKETGGYVINITLFLCDGLAQDSNVIAFNRTTPYIVRKYSSSVELRNMTFR